DPSQLHSGPSILCLHPLALHGALPISCRGVFGEPDTGCVLRRLLRVRARAVDRVDTDAALAMLVDPYVAGCHYRSSHVCLRYPNGPSVRTAVNSAVMVYSPSGWRYGSSVTVPVPVSFCRNWTRSPHVLQRYAVALRC